MEAFANDFGILTEIKAWHWGPLISYFLGSIPFGLLIGKFFLGCDVRLQGSGNIGMTNVMRVGGKKAGLATLILDMGKAVFGVWLTITIFDAPLIIALAAGAMAILGHTNSIFLGFKGGKGVASNFGVWLIIDWRIFAAITLSWAAVFFWKKISGLASIVSLITLPLTTAYLYRISSATVLTVLIAFYLIVLHRSNIQRLFRGQESALIKTKRG